jgi:prepilin peptidase CpaA
MQIGLHVGLAGIALGIGFFMFAMGWIGGGDAKLFAATALWLGPQHVVDYAIVAAILGGVLTLAILGLRMTPLPAGFGQQEWLLRLHNPRNGVPYGIALAAAALWIYPSTIWMQALGN